LEDWELLAVLFGTGVKGKGVEVLSKELLLEFSSLYHLLYTPEKILLNRKGLGKAKVTKLSAVRELLNRVRLQTLFTVSDTKKLESLKEYLYLKSRKETRECFFLVTFGAGDNVLRVELVTRGSLKEVGVYFRDLVKMILDDGAASALISHNHPSQPAQPSSDDWELFQEFRKILLPLDVDLIDQWVMGIDGIFSCAANKLFTIPQAV
jgi:DNA repair protein RadC